MFAKVFELLIKNQLYNFLEEKKLLSSAQFGFRKSCSTYGALADFIKGVVEGFEDGRVTSGLLFDLRKAFDCVAHDILLTKLENCGVRGLPLILLKSYLDDRRQFVCVNGQNSGVNVVKYGIPQGSVLGPLLFIIYINDLPAALSVSKVVLFADDTSVLVSADTISELQKQVEATERDITNWFLNNKLSLNADKTQKIVFSLNHKIYSGLSVSLLGVLVDDSLKWKLHIEQLCRKLSKYLFLLRRLRSFLSQSTLLSVYFSLIHSGLKYCVALWGYASGSDMILKMQKKAIRIICNIGGRVSCRELFKKLKILTVTSEYIFAVLREVHADRQKYSAHSDSHGYNTRHCSNIVVPMMRLSASKSASLSIHFYNKLPFKVRKLNTHEFKLTVKAYLLQNTFYSCREFLDAPPWP